MSRTSRWCGVLLCVVAATSSAGCAGRSTNAANVAPVEATTVRVDNQGFLDMNVYAIRSGIRHRLGTVTGHRTAVLTIPASLVQPQTLFRFVAEPIGGQRTPVSQEIGVSPGDEVVLTIPPG